jgi:hypothetical protein
MMQDEPRVARPDGLGDGDQQDMIVRLEQMLARAKSAKAKVAGSNNEVWETLWDFYIGGENHWKGYPGRLTGYQRHTYNRIGRNIEIAEALLEEMHISAEVQPVEPTDDISSALLDIGKDAVLGKEYNQHAVGLTSRYARIVGTGVMKVSWDASLYDGLGDVRYQMWPVEDFWLDPDALDLDTARYVITETRMDRAEAETKFGRSDFEGAPPKDKELGERVDSGTSDERISTNQVNTDGTAASTSTYLMPGAAFFSPSDHGKQVLVREYWVRDDPKRWPNLRHIITVGKTVVLDENCVENHGKFPFAIMVDQVDPKSAYGDAAARQAVEMQRELNLMLSLIALATHLNVVSPWVRYPQSRIPVGVLQKQASVANGILNCAHPAFKPERLAVGNINPRLFDLVGMLIEYIDKVMRVQDVIPPGARGFPASGEVVRELRETQLVEIRQKAANRARFMKRVIELTCSLMQQFYATDRWIRVTGPLPESLLGYVGEDAIAAKGQGDEEFWVKMNSDNIRHGWDVHVVESVWEPLSRQAQLDRVKKLAEADQFNTISVADIFELEQFGPVGEQVKRRVMQRAKAQAEAAAAQAQAAPPGAPGAPPQGAM